MLMEKELKLARRYLFTSPYFEDCKFNTIFKPQI